MAWHYLRCHDRSKYRRKQEHCKKEESPKAAWREHKQFSRDKSKGRGWNRGFSKKWYKRFANKKHRAWERDGLTHEKWDELTADYTRVTHDPWDIY